MDEHKFSEELLGIWWKIGLACRKQSAITKTFSVMEMMICNCILQANCGNKELNIKDLSEMIGTSQPSLVRTLNSLENRGMIDRYQCKDDRRSVYVRLSDKAIKIYQEVRDKALKFANHVIEQFGEIKSLELLDNMNQLYQYLLNIEEDKLC